MVRWWSSQTFGDCDAEGIIGRLKASYLRGRLPVRVKLASSLSALGRRRTRLWCYGAVVLVLVGVLAFGAVTADPGSESVVAANEDERWSTSTVTPGDAGTSVDGSANGSDASTRNRTGVLVTVQSYGGFGQNNGRAVLVRDGDVVWSFAPEDSRVFDAEMLDNGNVLVSYATALSADDCPERTLDVEPDQCVRNNVVELDYETNDPVWAYRWYDAFIDFHEVHDADRLPSGETAIIDMGNDRSFVVAENESVVWEWSAREHMGPGSAFWEKFGGPERSRPEGDWTHMNDIDLTDDGHFLMSIRNFDVVVEVNRSSKEIVHVTGEPRDGEGDVAGREPVLNEQHNPMLVGNESHVVVADSEADRIVELDRDTGEVVWSYSHGLLWPRDADRLPNGNTLVTNSLGYEVLEVTPDGEIVWSYQVAQNGKRGIPYEADRVVLPEELSGMPVLDPTTAPAGTATTAPAGTATTAPRGTATATETGASMPTDGDSSATADESSATVEESPTAGDGSTAGTGESEDAGTGVVDRYRGYALLYLPGWIGALELWSLLGLVGVGVVASADGVAYAVERAREKLTV